MHLYEIVLLSLIFGVWIFGVINTLKQLIKQFKEDERQDT